MNTLFVNDIEMPCERAIEDGKKYDRVQFVVEYPLSQAQETFVDGVALKVVWEDETERDYSDFKVLEAITYKPDGKLSVTYRKLSDLEKLIELHYGGVNNEGSI